MKSPSGILAAIVASLFMAHPPLAGAAAPAGPNESKQVTYAADLKPIFDASCTRCHNADKAKAGLRMDSLEGVLQGDKKHKLVVPGNSADSRLVKIIESITTAANDPEKKTKSLHKKGPKPLTREQISLLKSWIDQGAR